MEYIEVTGGNPLRGSIRPAAAKNSVLPLLAATLLLSLIHISEPTRP
mgnify:CR=1 FL=1